MATSVDPDSSTTSGLKRKRDAGSKFYAVRVGHKPGIYHSWSDCLAQVKGFKGAAFKSFASLTDAEAWLKADANAPSTAAPGTPTKFYAVANGHRPGIYTDWPSAQKQITGWQKPKHKSFTTQAEAQAWLTQTQAELNGSATSKSATNGTHSAKDGSPAAKRQKVTEGFTSINGTTSSEFPEPGTDSLPNDAEDGFDHRILLDPNTGKLRWKTQAELQQTRPQSRIDTVNDTIYIYTDGACRANGQHGAVAGVGVFFGKDDPRYVARFSLAAPPDHLLGYVIEKDEQLPLPWGERAHQHSLGKKLLPPLHLPTKQLSKTLAMTYPKYLSGGEDTDLHEYRRKRRKGGRAVGQRLPQTTKTSADTPPRNLSEPLLGARQTNQRAELTALKRALDITPLNRHVHIFSDSNYAIKCVTEWFINWRKNDWKTSSKKAVENRDIVEEILARIEEREQVKVKTRFEWLKGHADSEGNNEADRLAVEGANDAKRRGLHGATADGGADGEEYDGVVEDEDQGAVIDVLKNCADGVEGIALSFEDDGGVNVSLKISIQEVAKVEK